MSAIDLTSYRGPARHRPAVAKAIPFDEYLAIPAVNWSSLSNMDVSPLKYRDEIQNPSEPSATMTLGSAIHCAALEPHLFEATYGLFDGRRGTTAHAAWQVEHPGLVDLKPDEWEQCMGAAWAVHRGGQGRDARRVMRGARRELSLIWTDPATGIRCKARPDIVRITTSGVAVLGDVKTTTTVDARKFGRLSADMLYHCKMAFAARGVRARFGREPSEVTIIAVEQKRPHDVGVFPLDPDVLLAGEELVGKLLLQLKNCRKRRTWPGRYSEPTALDFPAYALPSSTDLTDCGIDFAIRETR